MQVWKQVIIKKVVFELQAVEEVVEAQKVEMEFLKKQVQDIEAKLEMLERELGVLRGKKSRIQASTQASRYRENRDSPQRSVKA